MNSIWIGFDPREAPAFAVARYSVLRHLSRPIAVRGLIVSHLQARGLYTRPIEYRAIADGHQMWDVISNAPMSTQHANARFLVPILAREGWALSMDGDMLARGDLVPMFDSLDPAFAVYCVKHKHVPKSAVKMDGQIQTTYARKNWSSFMVFNCDHPANRALTPELVNTLPGRDLHRFCWLDDSEIGELDPKFNFLVGHTDEAVEPVIVHHTDGVPNMRGYENVAFADDWRSELEAWAAQSMLGLPG